MNELDRFYREMDRVTLTAEQDARFAPRRRWSWEWILPVAAAGVTLVMLALAQRAGGELSPRPMPGIGGALPMEMVVRPNSKESSRIDDRPGATPSHFFAGSEMGCAPAVDPEGASS
jgi:hypothetical protein